MGGNKLWHFSGGGWTADNLPAQPGFDEATALGQVDGRFVIAGRVNKDGYILVYDPDAMAADAGDPDAGDPDAGTPLPTGWALIAMRGPQVPRGFFGGGPASTTGYVVGDYGAVWSYAAGTFTELSKGFYSDVKDLAVTSDAVIAIANDCLNASCSVLSGKVYSRVVAGDWELLGGASQPAFPGLHAVAARSGSEVMVTTDNAVYRWDGVSWTVLLSGGLSGPIEDLKYCGTGIYGVGPFGAFYKGTPTMLGPLGVAGSADLAAVACKDESEIWAAGDGALYSRINNLWVPRNSTTVNHAPYLAAWTPGPQEVFAFGAASYGVYFDNVDLQVIQSPGGVYPDRVNGMWGSTIDNLYLVGFTSYPVSFGFALRFDGADWAMIDSGAQREVTAIDGSSNTEVWVGTKGGGILHGANPRGP